MPTITFNPAPVVDLGDKIVADINANAWVPAGVGAVALVFTARRLYYETDHQPTETTLEVLVRMRDEDEDELIDRGGTVEKSGMVCEIGVIKKLADPSDKAEVDALVNFVYALSRKLYRLQAEFTVSGTQKAHCVKQAVPFDYSPEELDKHSRFFSIAQMTFEGWYE